MTDGERLVWSASYATAIDRGGDPAAAARSAARAVTDLRELATRRQVELEADARDFLDEIVSVP